MCIHSINNVALGMVYGKIYEILASGTTDLRSQPDSVINNTYNSYITTNNEGDTFTRTVTTNVEENTTYNYYGKKK